MARYKGKLAEDRANAYAKRFGENLTPHLNSILRTYTLNFWDIAAVLGLTVYQAKAVMAFMVNNGYVKSSASGYTFDARLIASIRYFAEKSQNKRYSDSGYINLAEVKK